MFGEDSGKDGKEREREKENLQNGDLRVLHQELKGLIPIGHQPIPLKQIQSIFHTSIIRKPNRNYCLLCTDVPFIAKDLELDIWSDGRLLLLL